MREIIELIKISGIPFKTDVKSAGCCLYGGGGRLKIAVYPKSEEHLSALNIIIKESGAASYVFGGFSNTLVRDYGYSGISIFTENLRGIEFSDSLLTCGAGEKLPKLSGFAYENSLTGFEAFGGIPASAGGAAVMNAGAYGSEIKGCLVSLTAFDLKSGEVKTYLSKDIPFGYRTSGGVFRDKVITKLIFKPGVGEMQEIAAKMREYKQKRQAAQPKERSLGSVFKNGNGLSAGWFVEKASLKGITQGGAKISEKHANFIVNTGSGTAEDYEKLMELAKGAVYGRFGVELKEEVIILGER